MLQLDKMKIEFNHLIRLKLYKSKSHKINYYLIKLMTRKIKKLILKYKQIE